MGIHKMNLDLGIVGCRHYQDYESFVSHVNTWIRENGMPDTIISGGAEGTDSMAEKYAREYGIDLMVFSPERDLYGDNCYRVRNQKIVDNSTHLLAFPSSSSKGTYMTINMAKKKGISVTPIYI